MNNKCYGCIKHMLVLVSLCSVNAMQTYPLTLIHDTVPGRKSVVLSHKMLRPSNYENWKQ